MTTSNLMVPLVVWGERAPTHCISSILMVADMTTVVTGCNDGQICIWDHDNGEIRPRSILLGHSAAVTCLAIGSNHPDKPYVVSSSDNGEMCLWDLSDGRCIEHTKSSSVHVAVQAYQLMHSRDIRLVCNGYYPEVLILHPLSLDVVFSLSSRIQPDWISALTILRPIKRENDVVVAITNSGTVKVWTLTGNEGKTSQQIFEDEAKQIRCLNAQMLRCCAYNQRTVLIICSKYWQIYDTNFVERDKPAGDEDGIYDAGDFSLLCSESSRRGERWIGGEFIGVDRVCVWSSEGKGYLYKLPTNLLRGRAVHSANPESVDFHKPADPSSPRQQGPQAYHILDMYTEKTLVCCPAVTYFHGRRDRESKILLRGDCEGRIVVWNIPDIHDKKMKLVRQDSFEKLPVGQPKICTSLQDAWQTLDPKPEGLLDFLNYVDGRLLQITATIYVPTQGRLVAGREDGTIVIVAAVETLMLHLMDINTSKDTISHQVLRGHNGRVNCLLYPHNDSVRYDANHLLSGGMDFTVILWDISTGSKLHTFCVHGGEITQLLVPPDTCNPRILPCVSSVASDHSLALLSLKERKCIMLASRQLFPIQTVKFRPLDDFLVIGCTDGTVYVWQMETGHLDRVVHGTLAEDILAACDEKHIMISENVVGNDIDNPTISLAQAFKRHNLATFRNFAQQRLQNAQHSLSQHQHIGAPHASLMHRPHAHPMLIQGLRTNTKDPDSHVVFFDTEAMIIQLLGEEYAMMSPNTLAEHGLASNQADQTQATASDPQKKLVAFMAKVRDKAENVGQKIQQKAESAGFVPSSPRVGRKGEEPADKSSRPKNVSISEKSLTMHITQFCMSVMHAWGQDPDLDKMCLSKLGMIKPRLPIAFGMLSRGGHMSLLLPGWHKKHMPSPEMPLTLTATRGHWLISSAITTHHLLSLISVANTLMSMTYATFMEGTRVIRRKQCDGQGMMVVEHGEDEQMTEAETMQQAQTKQGWSLLAALHCVLLPDLIGRDLYKQPQLEMLARRWQDRCLEIREAAQALLLAELRRIGSEGRKQVVDDWSPYLPSYVDPALSLLAEQQQGGTGMVPEHDEDPMLDDDDHILGDFPEYKVSQSFDSRRKQATAIVMMGVLGAEFGQEMEPSKRKAETQEQKKKSAVVEGFGITNYSHSRHTSKALTFLLLQPPSPKLPAFSPIRRAAIDLLGRGFTVWEPYLDVSAVLLGLLELCVDGDRLVPREVERKAMTGQLGSMTFGLPLTPQADACRTARHALSLIATARPPAFIITMAKEVARYNAMAQNAQTPHTMLHNSVLVRAKPEILRVLELLVEKIPNDVSELLVEVMDVTVHCLDPGQVKTKGLQELFPSICRFSMVSYCNNTRRICVGAKTGGVAFYELKQAKCQIMPAHRGAVIAVSFSPDGKFLASFSHIDCKLLFWQTASTSLFGIGSQQTRCVKTCNTPSVKVKPNTNLLKLVRLIWVDPRTVVLLTVDGTETKYKV